MPSTESFIKSLQLAWKINKGLIDNNTEDNWSVVRAMLQYKQYVVYTLYIYKNFFIYATCFFLLFFF